MSGIVLQHNFVRRRVVRTLRPVKHFCGATLNGRIAEKFERYERAFCRLPHPAIEFGAGPLTAWHGCHSRYAIMLYFTSPAPVMRRMLRADALCTFIPAFWGRQDERQLTSEEGFIRSEWFGQFTLRSLPLALCAAAIVGLRRILVVSKNIIL